MKKRREKINKYADKASIEAEFDFHDRGVLLDNDVKKLADFFIEDCLNKGYKRILFITGKGLHSGEGGPKIKPFLMNYLLIHPHVLNFSEARRDRGGSGAITVNLL